MFLSHTGAQKGFVEQLNLDLQQPDCHSFFDLRQEYLPTWVKFPPLIIQAVHLYEVGVVIISKEFVRRKWAMLELVEMVRKKGRGDEITIITIFFWCISRWPQRWIKLELMEGRVGEVCKVWYT